MLNQITLIGRIAKDPVMQTTDKGISVTRLTLAVRRPFRNNDGNYDTDFFNCTAWKKLAETSADYCSKGSLVCVQGRLSTRNYETTDNKKLTMNDIIAETITFLQLKRVQPTEATPIPNNTVVAASATPPPPATIRTEDLPF
ncbi:single-stranded DNA-binding protein [Evansella sp. AB-rgal1]|uniref:single-stranded DNA-binding protein n=1 Tax=Evansella sp. AB-rgal1 TaxID=3242696 RepID=UPI00359F0E6B